MPPSLTSEQDTENNTGLQTNINRNHILLAQLYWLNDRRELALEHMAKALRIASTTGAVGSFLNIGKVLNQHIENLDEPIPYRRHGKTTS